MFPSVLYVSRIVSCTYGTHKKEIATQYSKPGSDAAGVIPLRVGHHHAELRVYTMYDTMPRWNLLTENPTSSLVPPLKTNT